MSLRHNDDYFETPPWLFNDIKKETKLNFDLDFSASEENTKCDCYISEEMNALNHDLSNHIPEDAIFCNPPRSKNGKFVTKLYRDWKDHNLNIIMLLCWNDLGNKYGAPVLENIINGNFKVKNLGKVKFNKNGIESKFPSRLTYFWAWFKSR